MGENARIHPDVDTLRGKLVRFSTAPRIPAPLKSTPWTYRSELPLKYKGVARYSAFDKVRKFEHGGKLVSVYASTDYQDSSMLCDYDLRPMPV